ncbi:MAG: hypothetical protein AAFY46_03100, partial [Planctomycetota bacterium]
EDRNPAWLSGGIEVGEGRDRTIAWGEPQIVLYDEDPATRISYPDLVMEDGRFWVFETQKSVARLHEIPAGLIEGLFDQFGEPVRADDAVIDRGEETDLSAGEGFSIELWFDESEMVSGEGLASDGSTWSVRSIGDERRLEFAMGDGSTEFVWQTDVISPTDDWEHAVVFVIDGDADIVTVVADGRLQDGDGERQFGWGRLTAKLGEVGGREITGAASVVLHGRALTTAEAVGNTRAGVPSAETAQPETAP